LGVSIPNIAFVEGDPVAFENFANLFLVAKFLMMLWLVEDIGRDRFHVGLADGEGAVSILPPKAVEPLLFEAL
jgi:hypothetical protein